jgi:predicted membrane chloride channel (bestrophin family)
MLLLVVRGTVLSNWVLWAEQVLVMLSYLVSSYIYKLLVDLREDHDSNAAEVRGLANSMASLAAFLLGFYTSLTVARWWRLRTDGIGNIWSSSSQLCMYISECVTRDEQVLTSIRRYARASLILRFLQRRYPGKLAENLHQLVDKNVLTDEEVQKLKEYNNNLAESIWTWVTRIVMNLYRKGDINNEIMLNFILEKVAIGRGGAALIGAQMGTPIPLPYVHLLGFLVKIHNYSLALCSGYLLAVNPSEWLTLTVKAFLVPFLYNSILLINADLADPFDGGLNDFPLEKYQSGVEDDGHSYLQAGDHTPEWMRLP